MKSVDYSKVVLPIAEMTNGIILEEFIKTERYNQDAYQTEAELEQQLIEDLLQGQQYERFEGKTPEDLLENLRHQIQALNGLVFSPVEWQRFLDEYLDKASDGMIEKTRKIQENHIYDFIFDDGRIKNIMLIDKKNIHHNKLQVANQITQKGSHTNRYDVTILVNGLPLVQIELKKRGLPMTEAFHQVHRYSKESFNTQHSLFQYVQIFVVSNGTRTRYFANTTAKNKNSFEFTCEWADRKNKLIHDLEDFAQTFLNKQVLLSVLTKYCVFDTSDTLLIMRPYQIAATEAILRRIHLAHENKLYGSVAAGGYIWHTTGSGKTLTSFKVARLATELDYIDKVFFVVDRKDLDYQTMKEYQKFQKDSVNGSKDTKELKQAIEKQDNKIVVTTIQKFNEFVKKNPGHPIFEKQCVMIYDECHRSQFGEAQGRVRSSFKAHYQFGFTGTPIFKENSLAGRQTSDVFGKQLHAYIITDAIRDGKVLKFKVDYNYIRSFTPTTNYQEVIKAEQKSGQEQDEKILKKMEKQLLLHPERIARISEYLLEVYGNKTHRNTIYQRKQKRLKGFNAMFAVQSVQAAKMYYEELSKQQAHFPEDKRLRIATIFSFTPNEAQEAYGAIEDETFEPRAMDSSAKEFLEKAIDDYNKAFKTNFSTEGADFQNYYKDLSKRVKDKEVDLLIVVGMFLTGFDAPTMNTLFVDKNLRYHGLIQAYSRTNRILTKEKPFGNIVCFRDLEKATKDALTLFGQENSIQVVLEKSFSEYMNGFTDEETNITVRGYKEVCQEILERFPDPTEIMLEVDKKEFVKLFGEVLKLENVLRNFDEFTAEERLISDGRMQDYRSVYVDIREEAYGGGRQGKNEETGIDLSEIEFEIELLKTDEINLDYIIALISEKLKENESKENLKTEISRVIRSSIDMRAKEDLVLGFINETELVELKDHSTILEAFYSYARLKKVLAMDLLAQQQKLQGDYRSFIERSIRKGYVSGAGTEINNLLPPTSRRQGARERKKQEILHDLQQLVETYQGI